MLLTIRKDQSSKIFGGVKFSINFRAQLSQEERDLINKYKVGEMVLLNVNKSFLGREFQVKFMINDFVNGRELVSEDIDILQGYEAEAKAACQRLVNILEVLRGFGGEYTVEILPEGMTQIEKPA